MIALLKKYSLIHPFPFHPLPLAAFPVLFLYSFNIRQMVIADIFFPLSVTLTGVVLLWILLTLILAHGRKAALASSCFVILFFSYGHIYDVAAKWNFFNLPHSRLIAATILAWAYSVFFLRFVKWDPRSLTRALNLAGSVLIVLNLGRIALYEARNRPSVTLTARDPSIAPGDIDPTLLPDIYYLVFDEYAHLETMARYYNYDNSPFIENLKARGFIVPSESRTRSPMTPQLLAQVLNMKYLTPGWRWCEQHNDYIQLPSSGSVPALDPWDVEIFQLIGYNQVATYLKSKGYRYIYFGSFIELGKWESFVRDHADEYYNYYDNQKTITTTEFQTILWSSTMLRSMYFHIMSTKYSTYYRRGALETLAQLEMMPKVAGPKFVFAHIMLPHSPFVFGPQGEPVKPVDYHNFSKQEVYLGQYIYTSQRIILLVNALLVNSPTPPIIIVQSDHGLRCHHPGIDVPPEASWKILNAFFLPGPGRNELYESISPVNTFRFVFNHYFNTDYELLEDD